MENIIKQIVALLMISCFGCSSNQGYGEMTTKWLATNKHDPTQVKQFYALELRDKNDFISYDSTVFLSDLGYKVNYYDGQLLSQTKAFYKPNLFKSENYSYNEGKDLNSLVVILNDDTTRLNYINNYDGTRLTSIIEFDENRPDVKHVTLFVYDDKDLVSKEVYELIDQDSTLIKYTSYLMDSAKGYDVIVETDLMANLTDSVIINYELRTQWTYKKRFDDEFQLEFKQTYSNDSSLIDIYDSRVGEFVLTKQH